MKILIIGLGQLGNALKEELDSYDVLTPSREKLDITDLNFTKEYIKKEDPDYVISTAAYHDLNKTEKYPRKTFEVNAFATGNLAEACKEAGATLVWISTNYVFGGSGEAPYSENSSPNPVNIYGYSKLLGEVLLRNNLSNHYIIRTGGIFGKKGQRSFVELMQTLSKKMNKVKVKDDEYCSITYAPDLAKGIHEVILRGEYGTYHLFNEGEPSWYDVAKEVIDNAEPITRYSEMFDKEPDRPENSCLKATYSPKLDNYKDAIKKFLNN